MSYTNLLYKLLDMAATDSQKTIQIGTFCPAETPELIEAITTEKLKELIATTKLAEVLNVTAEHKAMLFHTYSDYLHSLKLTQTTRSDLTDRYTEGGVQHVNRRALSHGDSLHSGTADHTGYLNYLKRGSSTAQAVHDFLTRQFPARVSTEDRKRNTLILGGAGYGKTELIKQLIHAHLHNAHHTIIVLDPHGDMADQIARWQENRNSNRLVLIDTTLDQDQKLLPIINPLSLPNPTIATANVAAQALTDAFAQMLGEGGELTNNMKTILHPCLVLLMMRKDSSLLDLLNLMTGHAHDIEAAGKILDDPMLKRFFHLSFNEDKWASTKAAIATRLQYLLQAGLYKFVHGKPTIILRQLMDSRKLIVIKLSKGKLGSDVLTAFGRLIIAQLQTAAFEREQIREADRVPVHLFIDEFHNFTSSSLASVLTETRKYALHATLAQQSMGQGMTRDFTRDLSNNTRIKITCNTGNQGIEANAAELAIKRSQIQSLDTGQYMVRVAGRPAFKLSGSTDLLGYANSMNDTDWQSVKADQLATYYRDQSNIDIDNSTSYKDRKTEFKRDHKIKDIPEPLPDDETNLHRVEFKPRKPARPIDDLDGGDGDDAS